MSDGAGSTLATEAAQPATAQPQEPAGGNPGGEGVTQGQPTQTHAETQVQLSGEGSWRDELPEGLRESPSLSKFDTVEGLANGYANLERMLGGDKVPVPKDWSDENSRQMLFDAVRPKSEDEYKFQDLIPEDTPDELLNEYSKDEEKYWRQIMFNAGLSEWQAQQLFAAGVKPKIDGWHEAKAQKENELAGVVRSLRREWGEAYDRNCNIARNAIREFNGQEYLDYLDRSGEGNNPVVLRGWYKAGVSLVGETRLSGTSDSDALTPQQIEGQAAEHFKKHEAALMDSGHPEHALRVRERQAFFDRQFGTDPITQ